MSKLKVLSLFDGIGGGRQALKELNIDCDYFAIEIDRFAYEIAISNHSDIYHLSNSYVSDVRDFLHEDFEKLPEELKNICHYNDDKALFVDNELDLLIAGFPCQSFSIAGNRKGFEDERGSLFYEVMRILKLTKPKYFILENVYSMGKENAKIISKELFDIEPIMINSALLTAQNRKRLYWVGKLVDGKYEQVKIDQPEDQKIYLKDIVESGVVDRDKSYCIDANYFKGGNLKSYFEKGRGQLVFDKPVRIGYFNSGGQGDRIYSINGKSICLSANGGGRGAKTGLYKIGDCARMLTPKECERLQGFPVGYTEILDTYFYFLNNNIEITLNAESCKINANVEDLKRRSQKLAETATNKDHQKNALFVKQNFSTSRQETRKLVQKSATGNCKESDIQKQSLKTKKSQLSALLAKEKQKPLKMGHCVYYISKDLLDIKNWNYQSEILKKIKNVSFVMKKLGKKEGQKECVLDITRTPFCTEIQNILKKLESLLIVEGIKKELTVKLDTEKYWKIILEENLQRKKLFIILIALKLITELKIFIYAKETANISFCINNLEDYNKQFYQIKLSNFLMENITSLIKPTNRYKALGNSFTVPVIKHILNQLLGIK